MSEEKARAILAKEGLTPQEIEDFLEGCRKGLKAAREGKVKSWSEVKRELGIDE
jgi:hypothetical protein